MDNRKGQFEALDEAKFSQQMELDKPMAFKVREILEVRSSRFRVEKILRNKLVLKLLKQI